MSFVTGAERAVRPGSRPARSHNPPQVVICSLIVFFPVAIATMVGIRSVDARLLELGRSLRATHRQVLTTLEIPAALPSIFGGMRVGVTLAVVGAFAALAGLS